MNNYKDYPGENYDRIKVIKLLKQYGFTLQECGVMLQILDSGETKCIEIKKLLSENWISITGSVGSSCRRNLANQL